MTRGALLAATLMLALPVAAPAGAEPPPAFVAPDGPLILTRVLRRDLPDGKAVVATRRYELRIRPDDDGFRVDGRLLAAEVEVPPMLAALAAIERRRGDEGLFPIRLDSRGLIASATAPADRAAIKAAGTLAQQAISHGSLSPAGRQEAGAFVDRLVAQEPASSGAQWPVDLFRPAPGRSTSAQSVPLPGGQTGRMTTTLVVTRDAMGDRIERTVVTETGGYRRVTREIYSLSPAAE